MWGVLFGIWTYRNEILLGAQLLASMRRTAREVAREYIRRRIATHLWSSLVAIVGQLGVLALAGALEARSGTRYARLLASSAVWGITLYHAFALFSSTVPEIRAVRRSLRSKPGYSLKYLLQISIVIELMRWNILFPVLCLFAATSSRGLLGARFSYVRPWVEILSRW